MIRAECVGLAWLLTSLMYGCAGGNSNQWWGDDKVTPKPIEVPGQPLGGFTALAAAPSNCALARDTGLAYCWAFREWQACFDRAPLLGRLEAFRLTSLRLHHRV